MKTAIFKGYDEEGEVWAIGKAYGSGDTETKFICPIEPTKEIIDEYENRLYMSDRLEFINMLMDLNGNEKDEKELSKVIAYLDYMDKKEDVKYLYQKMTNWFY